MSLSSPQPASSPYLPEAWESALLARAQEAETALSNTPKDTPPAAPAGLASAYRVCARLTSWHSRTFYLAGLMLPPAKRQALFALYAFCRVADDIVDHPRHSLPERRAALARWRALTLSSGPPSENLVARAWYDTRQRFRIPLCYAEQLLQGVACDLEQSRFDSFADLAGYAYGVASTVGLMALYITGFHSTQALPYAIKLGVAAQITNILRDLGEDLRLGRLYLPPSELASFGLCEDDLAAGCLDERWRGLMRFQIERNRRLYAEAVPGIAMLHRDGRLPVAAAATFYAGILDDIEAHDYDVFSRRAHVTTWGKLMLLPEASSLAFPNRETTNGVRGKIQTSLRPFFTGAKISPQTPNHPHSYQKSRPKDRTL